MMEPKQWDVAELYTDTEAWRVDVKRLQRLLRTVMSLREDLIRSEAQLLRLCRLHEKTYRLSERISVYAYLNYAMDTSDQPRRARLGQASGLQDACDAAWDFLGRACSAYTEDDLLGLLSASPDRERCMSWMKRIRHMAAIAGGNALSGVDETVTELKTQFDELSGLEEGLGTIDTPQGPQELARASLARFLQHPEEAVRKTAYTRFYEKIGQHKEALAYLLHTLTKVYAAEAQKKGFPDTRSAVLAPDGIDPAMEDLLISTVRKRLPDFHAYFQLKSHLAGKKRLDIWDLSLPSVHEQRYHMPYEQAVQATCASVGMLGQETVATLRSGMLGGWVHWQIAKGKLPGSFTASCYDVHPWVLVNYKPEVPQSLFTLAHESGHALHSLFSARSNGFETYQYSVLATETVANVHELLLFAYISQTQKHLGEAFLLERQLEGMYLKLVRQTMIAEFEHAIHQGKAGTLGQMRNLYRELLETYYGPHVAIPPEAELEFLTIPHAYTPYYVHTYPVGLCAALTIAEPLIRYDGQAIERYHGLLRSGGNAPPVELLAEAGAHVLSTTLYERACDRFSEILGRFNTLVCPDRRFLATPSN